MFSRFAALSVVGAEETQLMQKSGSETATLTMLDNLNTGLATTSDLKSTEALKIATHAMLRDASQTSDPEVMARVGGFAKAMKKQMNELQKAILDEHKKDHQSVLDDNGQVALCNSQMHANFNGETTGVDAHNKKVFDFRSSHTDCRSDEIKALDAKASECGKADDAATIVSAKRPGCLDSLDTNDKYQQVACLKKVQEWMDTYHSSLTQSVELCDTRKLEMESKVKECDTTQSNFESEFCTYSTRLTDTCSEHNACHSKAVTARQELVDAVNKKAASQAEMWKSLAGMKCLLDTFEDAESKNVDASRFDSCMARPAVNTANFTHTFPDYDAQEECDTSSQFWNVTEYESFTEAHLNAMQSCISHSHYAIEHGSIIILESKYNRKFLDVCGGSCGGYDVVAHPTMDRDDGTGGGTSTWSIEKVNGTGPVSHNDLVYVRSRYAHKRYLDVCGGSDCGGGYNVVASDSNRRDGNSGTWQIQKVTPSADVPTITHGDQIYLRNQYSGNYYLDVCGGKCGGYDVEATSSPRRAGNSGTWAIQLKSILR